MGIPTAMGTVWTYLNKFFVHSRMSASWTIALHSSSFLSHRTINLLYLLFSQAWVLSTTQRIGLSSNCFETSDNFGAFLILVLQGIIGKNPLRNNSCLRSALSYPLSASMTIISCFPAKDFTRSTSFKSSVRSLPWNGWPKLDKKLAKISYALPL